MGALEAKKGRRTQQLAGVLAFGGGDGTRGRERTSAVSCVRPPFS